MPDPVINELALTLANVFFPKSYGMKVDIDLSEHSKYIFNRSLNVLNRFQEFGFPKQTLFQVITIRKINCSEYLLNMIRHS